MRAEKRRRQTVFFFLVRRERRERSRSPHAASSQLMGRELFPERRRLLSSFSQRAKEHAFFYRLSTKNEKFKPRKGREGTRRDLSFFVAAAARNAESNLKLRIAARRMPSSTGVSRPQLSRSGLLTLILGTTCTRDERNKDSRGQTEADCCVGAKRRNCLQQGEKPDAGRQCRKPHPPRGRSLPLRACARNQNGTQVQAQNSPKARRAKRTAKRRVIFGSLGKVIEFGGRKVEGESWWRREREREVRSEEKKS